MTLSQSRIRQLATIAVIVALSATLGGLYGLMVAHNFVGAEPEPLAGVTGSYLLGGLRGAVTGLLISLAASLFEIYGRATPPGRLLLQQPFPLYLAIRSVIYLAIFAVGMAAGQVLVPIPGDEIADSRDSWLQQIAVSYLISFVITTGMAINDLLGPGMLWRLLTGRYHRPRQEERIFLVLDLKGSTAIAERIGDRAFLSFLDQAIFDITEPLLEQRAEIYKYVGDEIIATWPLEEGLRNARCVRACFDAADRLRLYADAYRRLYGEAPVFRAALHAGPVVTGELGHVKREIAYLGDTLNTAARIEQVAKSQDRLCLVSEPLLRQLELPPGIVAEPLGVAPLPGKQAPPPLYALSRVSPASPPAG